MTINNTFQKAPLAVLEYVFDWKPLTNLTPGGITDWLRAGETIASFTLDVDAGITVDASSITDGNTSVTVWFSGGSVGSKYTAKCRIVTSNSPARKDTRSIVVEMVDR